MKDSAPTVAIVVVLVLAVLLVAGGFIYRVDEREQVVVTRFGQVRGETKDAGLHLKMPFVDTVNRFDKRILEWDGAATEIPTKDKKFILINTWARWRIVEPRRFLESRRSEAGGQAVMDQNVEAATRDLVSSHPLIEIVRSTNRGLRYEELVQSRIQEVADVSVGRAKIVEQIKQRAAGDLLEKYGMELIDFRIKHVNYREDVRQAVYNRMKSERQKIADLLASEGDGEKAKILGKMQKDLDKIESEGYKQAEETKGNADAEALKIYAEAYQKDPELYSFLKTLETYEKIFKKGTSLILSTDGDLFRYLKSYAPGPEHGPSADKSGAGTKKPRGQ